ncbi:MAG: beta-propeller fold lactonase family protein [Thiohalomonadales bacterium]
MKFRIIVVTARLISLQFLLGTLFISTSVFAQQKVSRFAYVANPFDYTLSQFTLDADGFLHANGYTYVADKFPALVSIHPSQKYLYTASRTVDTIRAYRIDPVSGTLTEIDGSPFDSKLRSPFYGDFHPSGKFFYLAGRGGGVGAYKIDLETGKVSDVDGQPFKSGERTRSLRVHPTGKYLYTTNAYSNDISAYRINQKNGVLTQLKGSPYNAGEEGPFDDTLAKLPDIDTNKGGLPYNVSIHPDGNFLYVSNFVAGSISVFRIDQDSGELKLLYQPIMTGLNPFPTIVHPNGNFLYVAAWGDNDIWVYKINKQSGELTLTDGAPFEGFSLKPVDFSFNPEGTRLYTANVGEHEVVAYDIDVSTGAVSFKQKIRSREGALDIELVNAKQAVIVEAKYAFVLDKKGKRLVNFRVDADNGTFDEISTVPSGTAPVAIMHDPKGRAVFMTNRGDDNVTVFRLDSKSGKMTKNIGSPHPMGAGPTQITIDVNGWYVYVLNQKDNTVSMHLMHKDSAELAEAIGSPMSVSNGTRDIAVDSMARFLYTINTKDNKIAAYRTRYAIAPARYEMKEYGSPFSMHGTIGGFLTDPNGRWAMVSNSEQDTISVYGIVFSNGALFEIEGSPFKTGKQPTLMAMHPLKPYLYVLNKGSADIDVFAINNRMGTLTKKHNVKTDPAISILQIDPSGRFMYALVPNKKGMLKFSLDPITGKPSPQDDIALDFVPAALSISSQLR